MRAPATPVLVDTSVWTRIASRPAVAAAITARLADGQALCTCPLVDLELLHSARGPDEYDDWAATRAQAYPSLSLTPAAGAGRWRCNSSSRTAGYIAPPSFPTCSSRRLPR